MADCIFALILKGDYDISDEVVVVSDDIRKLEVYRDDMVSELIAKDKLAEEYFGALNDLKLKYPFNEPRPEPKPPKAIVPPKTREEQEARAVLNGLYRKTYNEWSDKFHAHTLTLVEQVKNEMKVKHNLTDEQANDIHYHSSYRDRNPENYTIAKIKRI